MVRGPGLEPLPWGGHRVSLHRFNTFKQTVAPGSGTRLTPLPEGECLLGDYLPVIAGAPKSSVSELVGAHGVLCADVAAVTQWAGGRAHPCLTHSRLPLFSRSVIGNH